MRSVSYDNGGAEEEIRSLNSRRLGYIANKLLIALKDRGFDLATPCGSTNCWIGFFLPVLNKTLFEVAMCLTENLPGAFTLSSIQSVDADAVRSDSSLMEGAILLHWLLKHHHCIKRLVLGTDAIPVTCFPALLSGALLANKGLVEVQAHPVDMSQSWREIRQCSVLATALAQVSLKFECLDMTPIIIDHQSAHAIANSIRHGRLRRLVLWNDMSRTVAKKLFFAANASSSLSSLEIAGFQAFSKSSALVLSAAMKHNKTLRKLSVKFMMEDCLGIILTSLEQNDTLKELCLHYSVDLSRSKLWDGLQALRTNSGLTCVELTNADFNNSCAIVIADVLRENNTLQELSISTNWIGNAGGRALAQALIHNSSLKRFDVSKNRMTGSVVQYFVDSLAVNSALESVRIGDVALSEEWSPTWPLTGNVHARLHVTWNTRGLKGCAEHLGENGRFPRLYVGWTDDAGSSGIVQWFSAARAISTSLTELTIECPQTVEPTSSAAIASFLKDTSSLKKLVVRPTSVSHTFVTEVISSLVHNKSVCHAEFHQNLRIDRDVKALQALFLANRTLHRLKFTGYRLDDKAPLLLARALEDNFVFLTFEFDHFIARNNMCPLISVLNRNRSLLNRAVERVLDVVPDSRSVKALELLSACDSLLEAVSDATGKNRDESKRLVRGAVRRQNSSSEEFNSNSR